MLAMEIIIFMPVVMMTSLTPEPVMTQLMPEMEMTQLILELEMILFKAVLVTTPLRLEPAMTLSKVV